MPATDAWLLARLIHVLAATFWMGAAVFLAAFLLPAVKAAGAAGTALMRPLTARGGAADVLAVAATLAVASGGYLLWINSGGLDARWLRSAPGAGYALGALAALVAYAIGSGLNIPAAYRLGRLAAAIAAAGTADPARAAEAAALARRLLIGTRTVAALLLLSTAAMAVARHLGGGPA